MTFKKITYFVVFLSLLSSFVSNDTFAQRRKNSRAQLEIEKKRNLEKID
jgi:hypothetical protein